MSEIVKESIAPLVQRILADPLRFVPAKHAEAHTSRPTTGYVKIGAAHSHERVPSASPKAAKTEMEKEQEKAVQRPTSLSQALAGYTGKRALDEDSGSKKRRRKEQKKESTLDEDVGESLEPADASGEAEESAGQESTEAPSDEEHKDEVDAESPSASASDSSEFVSETPHNIISAKVFEQFQSETSDDPKTAGSDEDDDEEDDDDEYNNDKDADESSESEETNSESDSQSPSHSQSETPEDEDVELLKKEMLNKATSTPPTSPESEGDEEDLQVKPLQLESFHQINAVANDRGSHKSQRTVKNWGPVLSSQKPVGLLNQGVTCYTNAAVQAMVHIPAVQHYLNDVLKNKYPEINKRSVTNVLAETAARMWNPEKKKGGPKFINPKKLIARLDDINCAMSEWQQEDSHEYFMSLLSRLQEDSTPKGRKLNESIIYDIFGGLLDQSVTCKNCGHVSKTQQEFYDLSLHLGSTRRNTSTTSATTHLEKEQPSTEESSHKFSIQKSIRDFFSPELIKTDRSDKSGYECENCKKHTNAIKISSIDRAPETLAVHLKRFRFNGSSSSKVKQGVLYPLILDLSPYTTSHQPVLYQLISVVVHAGRSVSSGHYVAHCRQPDGSWATYDDEYINAISEKQALKDSSAYYLIYTRLTHKDIIANPTLFKSVPPSPKAPSSPNGSSSLAPTPQENTLHSLGPTEPKAQVSPRHKFKKQKFGSMKPTNNLSNISGKKQKRYASKTQGSKRLRKY